MIDEKIKIDEDLVSVIVPVYNRENRIETCIKSILAQRYTKLEIIIIDDGSTDNSLSIIKKMAKLDTRIKVIVQSNQGVSLARNNGIREANGKWLVFVDSDDMITEMAIYNLIAAQLKYPTSYMVFGCFVVENGKNNKSDTKNMKSYYSKNDSFELIVKDGWKENISLWSVCGKLFCREFIIKNNVLFDENVNFGEDEIFNLELFKLGIDIAFIPSYDYIVHKSENSLSSKQSIKCSNLEKVLMSKLKTLKMKLQCLENSVRNIEFDKFEHIAYPILTMLFTGLIKQQEKTSYKTIYSISKRILSDETINTLIRHRKPSNSINGNLKQQIIVGISRFTINTRLFGVYSCLILGINRLYKIKKEI